MIANVAFINGVPTSISGFAGFTGVQLVTNNVGYVGGSLVDTAGVGVQRIAVRTSNNLDITTTAENEVANTVTYMRTTLLASDGNTATPAANTQASITLVAVANRRNVLRYAIISFSAAITNVVAFNVNDGATLVLTITLPVGFTGPLVIPLESGGLRGTVNTAMTIILGAGGAGISGVLSTGSTFF